MEVTMGMGQRGAAEIQTWEEFEEIRAEVIVEKKEDALRVAAEWSDHRGTVWTDGSRLEHGPIGAAWAFKRGDKWVRRVTFLGSNKEVFDAEVYAVLQAVRLLNDRNGDSDTQFS